MTTKVGRKIATLAVCAAVATGTSLATAAPASAHMVCARDGYGTYTTGLDHTHWGTFWHVNTYKSKYSGAGAYLYWQTATPTSIEYKGYIWCPGY